MLILTKVLILVVVEDGLVLPTIITVTRSTYVLILVVVVEDGLVHEKGISKETGVVLS